MSICTLGSPIGEMYINEGTYSQEYVITCSYIIRNE